MSQSLTAKEVEDILRDLYRIPATHSGPMTLKFHWFNGKIDWSRVEIKDLHGVINMKREKECRG